MKHTLDLEEMAERGAERADNMSSRSYNDSRNQIETCSCGAILSVPNGHTALDGEHELECHECDKPLGVKIYQALR